MVRSNEQWRLTKHQLTCTGVKAAYVPRSRTSYEAALETRTRAEAPAAARIALVDDAPHDTYKYAAGSVTLRQPTAVAWVQEGYADHQPVTQVPKTPAQRALVVGCVQTHVAKDPEAPPVPSVAAQALSCNACTDVTADRPMHQLTEKQLRSAFSAELKKLKKRQGAAVAHCPALTASPDAEADASLAAGPAAPRKRGRPKSGSARSDAHAQKDLSGEPVAGPAPRKRCRLQRSAARSDAQAQGGL